MVLDCVRSNTSLEKQTSCPEVFSDTRTFGTKHILDNSSNNNCYSSSNTNELVRRSSQKWCEIPASNYSLNTVNPILSIVESMQLTPNPAKALIELHLGDPTESGVLRPDPAITSAVVDSVTNGHAISYSQSFGMLKARQAVVDKFSCPEATFTVDDVIMTSGCSHALQIAFEVLANPGSNILLPAPGFPMYKTLVPCWVEIRYYRLQADRNWEADINQLDALIDCNTVALLVNNPSNPTGAVYSKEHLEAILAIAEKHKVPLIADEIYGDMVYDGAKFYPMASLQPKIPVLTCDGISKRYLVPGWRLGWLILHDRPTGVLKQVRECARKLSQKLLGPNVIIQDALKKILLDTPEEFFENTRRLMSENTTAIFSALADCPGVTPIRSSGAIYIMLHIEISHFPQFKDELDFCKALMQEQSVFCLPGTIFSYPHAIRLVLANPKTQIMEACERIKEFCLNNNSSRDK